MAARPENTLFDRLQHSCNEAFSQDSEEMCKSLTNLLESAWTGLSTFADWSKRAAVSLGNGTAWTWNKSGEHCGAAGQFVFVCLSAILARNLYYMAFGHRKVISQHGKQN